MDAVRREQIQTILDQVNTLSLDQHTKPYEACKAMPSFVPRLRTN